MKKLLAKWWLQHWFLCLSLGLLVFVMACSPSDRLMSSPGSLNSRYTDEQPALSGNGRYVAFISNRDSSRNLFLYDLQEQVFLPIPRLQNRPDAIAQSPSISYTGRYIVCIVNDRGKPDLVLYDRVTQRPQILNQWYQGWVRNPSISPDGRYVVFESSLHGQWDIEVLDRGSNIELDIPDGVPVNE
ncbi:TolB family protein [Gloeocapsopsis sp. IPPAS B-1203]|uniref:TolB family protein n=1 Tax=Gloeocapsopsis sp. IPPAS B-1203 TaxID=2049454 RepID=UPI000C1A434F|nr:TolB family protein [Gloeocapsopsis sp. IPPAS B-1203]PIG92983.1 biopolymer transporter Tol [Gloeocapsopsis sp. IPPAS B-1203]